MESVQIIANGGMIAEINDLNKQLFALSRGKIDPIAKGGAPEYKRDTHAWNKSGRNMFPIIGGSIDGKVTINGESYPMGQHGIAGLKNLGWTMKGRTEESITYVQNYVGGTDILNDDGKGVSRFPMSYALTEAYSLDNNGVLTQSLEIQNMSKLTMPCNAGIHPAFDVPEDATIKVNGVTYTMEQIMTTNDKNVIVIPNSSRLVLEVPGKHRVKMDHDFGTSMLWKKARDWPVCMEPITGVSLGMMKEAMEESGKLEPLDMATLPGFMKIPPSGKKQLMAHLRVEAI